MVKTMAEFIGGLVLGAIGGGTTAFFAFALLMASRDGDR